MTGKIVSNELQAMWKDEAVAQFKVPLSGFCIKYWKTPTKKSYAYVHPRCHANRE
jgi:hypothetical protein